MRTRQRSDGQALDPDQHKYAAQRLLPRLLSQAGRLHHGIDNQGAYERDCRRQRAGQQREHAERCAQSAARRPYELDRAATVAEDAEVATRPVLRVWRRAAL